MRRVVGNIAAGGIVRDLKPQELPVAAWSNGRNVRFTKRGVSKMGGVRPVFEGGKTGLLWANFATGVSTQPLMYATATQLRATNFSSDVDISRVSGGAYGATADFLWDSSMFNGFVLLNNQTDIPQSWNPNSLSNKALNLAAWDATWRARKLVGFKNFIVALAVTKGSTFFGNMVKWSTLAEPGALPTTWDPAEPSELAGEASLADTEFGHIVTAAKLRDQLSIYKDKSIWSMAFVGGTDVFAVEQRATGVGVALPRSLATVPITKSNAVHFFADDENFFVHDGLSAPEPIFDGIFKDEFLKLVDKTYMLRSFSVVNWPQMELWFCFPERGETSATLAFVWNYRDNTYSIRELGGCLAIASGLSASTTFSTEVDVPFSDAMLFSAGVGFSGQEVLPNRFSLIEASSKRAQAYQLDAGIDGYTGTFNAWVERQAAPSRPTRADFYVDYETRKLVRAMVVKLLEGTIAVQVGVSETDRVEPTWGPLLYPPIDHYKLDLPEPVSGRFVSFRFLSEGGNQFILAGYDYDFELLGEF